MPRDKVLIITELSTKYVFKNIKKVIDQVMDQLLLQKLRDNILPQNQNQTEQIESTGTPQRTSQSSMRTRIGIKRIKH